MIIMTILTFDTLSKNRLTATNQSIFFIYSNFVFTLFYFVSLHFTPGFTAACNKAQGKKLMIVARGDERFEQTVCLLGQDVKDLRQI